MMAAELLSGAVGFFVTVHLARALGPRPYARIEFALAVSAWLLVLVRSGIEQIVWREAARRPRLIGPLASLLLTLKFSFAVVGYACIALLAACVDHQKSTAILVAGLILPVSALVADVGARALGHFRVIALGQTLRALGWGAAVLLLVSGPAHEVVALACVVAAELLGAFPPTLWHITRYGWPRPAVRVQRMLVFMRRGMLASLTRFARVAVYGADILILGAFSAEGLGPYAAARRLAFAFVAIGLVVPTVLAPALARASLHGPEEPRLLLQRAASWQWAASIGAALVLVVAAGRWMHLLFGAAYAGAGSDLVVIAARLPGLLLSTLGMTALLAARREDHALRLALAMAAAAILLVPISVALGGRWTAGLAMALIESASAGLAFALLRRHGWRISLAAPSVVACLSALLVVAAGQLAQSWPHVPYAMALAFAYSLPWLVAERLRPVLPMRRAALR
jgi:O-antigen/teichoic acid export membrane protein